MIELTWTEVIVYNVAMFGGCILGLVYVGFRNKRLKKKVDKERKDEFFLDDREVTRDEFINANKAEELPLEEDDGWDRMAVKLDDFARRSKNDR